VTKYPPEIDYERQNQRPNRDEIAVGALVLAIGAGFAVLATGGLVLYASEPGQGGTVVVLSATAICGFLALFSLKVGLEFLHNNKRAGR
jgi:hypothetical protein